MARRRKTTRKTRRHKGTTAKAKIANVIKTLQRVKKQV